MTTLENIKELPSLEAIPLLNDYIDSHPQDEEAYILRGRKHWSLNHRREAINDYLKAIEINPESRARTLLEFSNSVLSFYNKDLLNP